MVCAPVRSIIPSLKLGDYLSYRRTNHALSLWINDFMSICDLKFYISLPPFEVRAITEKRTLF